MKFNRDRLMGVDHRLAAAASMRVLTRVQDYPAEAQVAGVAAVFVALCRHYGVRENDAFTVASNMLRDVEERTPAFQAVREYVKYELPR